ncbi:hypothetical protein QYG66_16375, partial [Xanthomonas euvesicatoria]|uniref:hypothetical protein n=1 Tax=Xanthomonas euvesicatoria TaxID=456327 RepID=UPI0032B5BFC3
ARVGLFDKPDDLLGAESALLHVRPLGFTDFIASAGTAQWGQVKDIPAKCSRRANLRRSPRSNIKGCRTMSKELAVDETL